MVARIPDELNNELLRRANAGETTRQLADWLVEEKKLPRCSHVTVSRRLFGLRAAETVAPSVTPRDVDRELRANAILLQDADEGLAELQEIALYGAPDQERKPDFAAAKAIAFKRTSLALATQRFLLARLRVAREAAQMELRKKFEEARRRPEPTPEEREKILDLLDGELKARKAAPTPPKAQPVRAEPAIGRNAPCPCGSGAKYKKCCWQSIPAPTDARSQAVLRT
jgi:hypothetical protein